MDSLPADVTEPFSPRISGKDELNLAEFPLCSISDRLQADQDTLVFEDRTWDANRGEMIRRQLTITASAQFGLPTALDDEVLLGLIQLSKLQDFANRNVTFTRYQLIRLLSWRNETRSYDRIESSLNRWVGVTLYYKNAWRNKKDQCWADEKFHILDNVTLFDRDQIRPSQGSLPLSTFTWNDVVFRSFAAGNLKSLDFDFYKNLKSAIAKRLYRFLDKRFFHRPRWEFDLKEVAWEHVGLARSYDMANLKRKLKPSIQELEEKGFLAPLPDEERFRKVCTGDWRVIFSRAKQRSDSVCDSAGTGEQKLIQKALFDRGVTSFAARELIQRYPLDRIKTQLEVFDWLVAQSDSRVSRNPAGFLVSSIKSEYAPPKGFLTREEAEAREKKALERKRKAEERLRRAEESVRLKEEARAQTIGAFWSSLSLEEKLNLEREAVEAASPLQRQLLERGGSGANAARKALLDAYALNMLEVGA